MTTGDATPAEPGVGARAAASDSHRTERWAVPSDDGASPTGHAPRAERQSIGYCPYCSEENLFPLEEGGWECRSCLRAFSVVFRGLVSPARSRETSR